MGAETAIAWCNDTFNPWLGCTKVAPECDNCYAAALDEQRYSKTLDGGTKDAPVSHWGPGAPRHLTKTWRQPIAWNNAQRKAIEAGSQEPRRVFGGSLMDWADNEVDPSWRASYWGLIQQTPYLTWLLLTKRAPNIAKMLPADFSRERYPHVWLGTTAGTQARIDTDGMRLLEVDAAVSFLSVEPILETINLAPWLERARTLRRRAWVIVGGESGRKARACDLDAVRFIVRCCIAARVPVFVKQLGRWPQQIAYPTGVTDAEADRWMRDGWTRISHASGAFPMHWRRYYRLKDPAGANPAEWPEDLRVREFPA